MYSEYYIERFEEFVVKKSCRASGVGYVVGTVVKSSRCVKECRQMARALWADHFWQTAEWRTQNLCSRACEGTRPPCAGREPGSGAVENLSTKCI